MQPLYDTSAPKKPTNLSLNSDLLGQARALNINLSSTMEAALAAKLAEDKNQQWNKDNAVAVRCYNQFTEANGCFSDDHRAF